MQIEPVAKNRASNYAVNSVNSKECLYFSSVVLIKNVNEFIVVRRPSPAFAWHAAC